MRFKTAALRSNAHRIPGLDRIALRPYRWARQGARPLPAGRRPRPAGERVARYAKRSDRAAVRTLLKPKGLLEFAGVNFGYSPRQQVLHDIRLRLDAGETVAVVGPNGSGKSSLVKLALRLYDPWSGEVRIDGHDVRDLTFQSMRQSAACRAAGALVVARLDCGKYRLRPGPADPAALIDAARAAHVSAFAEAMPGGYDRR